MATRDYFAELHVAGLMGDANGSALPQRASAMGFTAPPRAGAAAILLTTRTGS